MSQEIEFKFEVEPEAAERLMELSWFGAAEWFSEHQLSIYFDTPDYTLRKHGFILRVRSVGGRFIQTVKSLASEAGLFERGEWECEIDGPVPDLGKLAGTPLPAFDVALLQPVVWSDVNRTAMLINPQEAEVEIDIDEGLMTAAGHELPLCEIEIELKRGSAAPAVAIARRIAAEVPVKIGVRSKAERGFALADDAVTRVTKAEPVAVRPGMTVADGFQTIVTACIRHFRLNEPIVLERRDAEALHQVRVAMRRLRTALSLFRPAIRDDELQCIRDGLGWFTGELGDARNLDVYLQRQLPIRDRSVIEGKRDAAYARVIAALESTRFRLLLLDLVAWTSLGEWREGKAASQPLAPFANRRIDRLWSKVSDARVGKMDDRERHRLRIGIKKLRYALEFVDALHVRRRKRRKKFGRAVEQAQDSLGYFHDVIVARDMVASGLLPNLPGPDRDEERPHLRAAKRSLRRLREVGPYWRKAA